MNQVPPSYTEHPFHRGNFILRYTPEEEVYAQSYINQWVRTKGLLSSVVGGGITFALMKAGLLSSKYTGGKLAGGMFVSLSVARIFGSRKLNRELKDKYPNGYAAQMFYLRDHSDQYQDFLQYSLQQRSQRFTPTDRYPSMPSNQPVATSNTPDPVTRDYQETTNTPAGLDDRFRPQMDGILQGKVPLPDENDKSGKKPPGSYAMWRQQKPPQGQDRKPSDLPSYSPPQDPPRYSTPDTNQPPPIQPDSRYEQPRPQPTRKDPQPKPKPVRRNKYGDIIEDE